MGGAVSQFIAYAHAQHTSKHPETFGKGNVEGVIAAGAVNNSREGGNLIPTVAFGIPGSVSMAILLSVFLIKGLVPGPAMLTHAPERHLRDGVGDRALEHHRGRRVSFLFLNQLVRLTYVRAALLVPFLLVLTAFGAYTAHNSFADILLMLGATVVGVAAIRWDWPRAPLLLALVLGDIAERYLFLSYSLYEWTLADAAAGARLRGGDRLPAWCGRSCAAGARPAPRRRCMLAPTWRSRSGFCSSRPWVLSSGARLAVPDRGLPAGDRRRAARLRRWLKLVRQRDRRAADAAPSRPTSGRRSTCR